MKKIDITKTGDSLEIRLRWFSILYAFLLAVEAAALAAMGFFGLFAIVGRGISLLAGGSSAFVTALKAGDNDAILTIFIPLAMLTMLFGIYYSLCRLLNSTIITAAPHGIRVHHGPVPWARGSELPRSSFTRFMVEERMDRTKGGEIFYYRLMAEGGSGPVKLTVYLQDEDAVRAVKEELDGYYRLEGQGI